MSYIQDYINKMLEQKESAALLSDVDSTSKVSILRDLFYVVAFCANLIRELRGVHESENAYLIDVQKHTNLNYYREVLFNYRDGHTFDSETLTYTGTYTDEEIEVSKIVARAAAKEINENGIQKISLKLATEVNDELTAIDEITLARIKEHVRINAPAGTNLSIISIRPDELKLELNVYVDPQVLTTNGSRVDGTANNVVQTAVDEFFADKNFKFDGELVLSLLEDKIQAVEGIQDRSVRFVKVEANHSVPAEWELVEERYTSYSGYYKILELKVNYLIQ